MMPTKPSRAAGIAALGVGGAIGASAFSGPVSTGAGAANGIGLLALGLVVGAPTGWFALAALRQRPRRKWNWVSPVVFSLLSYAILLVLLQAVRPRQEATAIEAVGLLAMAVLLGVAVGCRVGGAGATALQIVGGAVTLVGGIFILLSLGNPADLVVWMIGGIALAMVGCGLFAAGTAARTRQSI